MKYLLSKQNRILKGEIILPASKSISNRLLLIKALTKKDFEIFNLSYSDDTKDLIRIINTENDLINVGDSGSNLRFISAFLANKPGEWILTGSERIKNRPIGIITSSLKELGVKIEFLEKEGFPPVKIYGTNLQGGNVELSGSLSSQFMSSLLLIAPTLPNGLNIKLKSKINAKSNIDMTLNLMRKFGIKSKWEGNNIIIKKQNYRSKDYIVESDWSSASYWYEMAAFADDTDIKLYGLKRNSIQGDSMIAELFKEIGIKTTFITGGVRLRKLKVLEKRKFEFNFSDFPDIIQTITVTLSALNIPFSLTGLETFIIKETNRIQSLKRELMKIGCNILVANDSISKYTVNNEENEFSTVKEFKICNDYRLALCLTPLALFKNIIIDDTAIVKKSYPGFWDDLQKTGFDIQERY